MYRIGNYYQVFTTILHTFMIIRFSNIYMKNKCSKKMFDEKNKNRFGYLSTTFPQEIFRYQQILTHTQYKKVMMDTSYRKRLLRFLFMYYYYFDVFFSGHSDLVKAKLMSIKYN